MDIQKVAKQIALLRKKKGLTQNDLGERLGISFQAVSKWERGESLPDTIILPELAQILETTVDYILSGGESVVSYKGRVQCIDLVKGLRCLEQMGRLLGTGNLIYRYAVKGINDGMNTDVEAAFTDDYKFEAFLAEAVIQNLMAGAYVDVTDVRLSFKQDHFRNLVLNYAHRHGIK